MAHLMKSTSGSTGGLTRHFQRFKNEKGEYLKFGNQEIDIQKTDLNYNLADDKNQLEFIKQRTSQVRCLKRKDVNVMASWVITLPESVEKQKDQEKFFQESYDFLEEKYGKENIISSFVHLDETTPHMHFAFVPVVYDKKRQDYKVSAKECITRTDLKQFHPQLEAHMTKAFGYEIGILNEKTKEGNRSIKELKDDTAINELKALKGDLKASRDELGMIALAEDEIKRMGQVKGIENKFINKDYVQIKKKTFEQFKFMAKNYKKDTIKLENSNFKLKKRVKGLGSKINKLEDKLEEKEKVKFSLKDIKEKAQEKNNILGLEEKVETLSNYIVNKGLADDYNKSLEQEKSRGLSR